MDEIHFLNVNEGDCILVKHSSNRITVIDICNGKSEDILCESAYGNHKQKMHPVNPIEYFRNNQIDEIFRFVLTHPDMDHMDGIKELFDNFDVQNFWDTENTKEISSSNKWGQYNKDDWDFYQEIRKSESEPKVLHLLSNSIGEYYSDDGLNILAPTQELVDEANRCKDYNDCSYVILFKTMNGKKIIFSGDSGEKTWNYILGNFEEDVKNIDILVAPHHGRKTGGNDEYLDILNPKLTLFGNSKSEYLDYQSWLNRRLDHITNNEAGNIILRTSGNSLKVFVTYENFAKKRNPNTFFVEELNAWYILTI